MISVGGFAFTQDGGELAVGLGAELHEQVVNRAEGFGAEIVDLSHVAEVDDDPFKCGIQFGNHVVDVGFYRHGPGRQLCVELLRWMGRVSFISSHICLPPAGDVVRARSVFTHRRVRFEQLATGN